MWVSLGYRRSQERAWSTCTFPGSADQSLAVLVTRSGLVRAGILRGSPPRHLERCARFINDNFRGWTMEAMRTNLPVAWNRNAVSTTG